MNYRLSANWSHPFTLFFCVWNGAASCIFNPFKCRVTAGYPLGRVSVFTTDPLPRGDIDLVPLKLDSGSNCTSPWKRSDL